MNERRRRGAFRRRFPSGEAGQVAGIEALAFGILVFVTGTLLIAAVWGALSARILVDAAAAEYLRSYTQSKGPSAGERSGHSVVADVVGGVPVEIVDPDPGGFAPCAPATVRITARVPAVRLPFVSGLAEMKVTATATELIDPHRSDTERHTEAPTPCD